MRRVGELLRSERAVDVGSVSLWRIPTLKGYAGFGSVAADRAEPGTWWTAAGLEVQRHPLLAREHQKLRKYLVRVRHFRGSATFGASRISGSASGAPLIAVSSVDEDDAVEEGEPPLDAAADAAPRATTVDRVERLAGVDVDGDGDIGVAGRPSRPTRTRVWDGQEWVMDWEYPAGRLGRHRGADWSVVRVESASSASICIEVSDPDSLSGGGRLGVSVVPASVGGGWQPVHDAERGVIGHVFLEIKKKKKKPKKHTVIKSSTVAVQKFAGLKPDSANGLGIRISARGIIVGYSGPGAAAEGAGVPVGAQVIRVNGEAVASRADILKELEKEDKAGSGWNLDFECNVWGSGGDAAPEPEPAATGAELPQFTLDTGTFYDFKKELEALDGLLAQLVERIDAVVLDSAVPAELAMGLMTRTFHQAVEESIRQRWGPSGRHTLEPAQLGELLSWLKKYLERMAQFGWTPTESFIAFLSESLFGSGGAAEAVSDALAAKVTLWVENCLESEDDRFEGEALRTTMPDDLLRAVAFLMEVMSQPQSVLWTLHCFRCVTDALAASIPSLLAEHALPGVTHSAASLIEPYDPTISDEVGMLLHARNVAREHATALGSGTAPRDDAADPSKRRDSRMEKILYGGGPPDADADGMLHLKYLCRVVNNMQRLAEGFVEISRDHFSPVVAESSGSGSMGLLESGSIEELKKQWGAAWTFDEELATLRGERNGHMVKTTRGARSGLLMEMGSLIVEADLQACTLLMSAGQYEWQRDGILARILDECVDPKLNKISTWLEARELHMVVGECLAKLVQLYGAQLLTHKRWDGAFETWGREKTAECVLADVTMLEERFGGLMGETSSWGRIKEYVLSPLRELGTLMRAGKPGWEKLAGEHLDMYDAAASARRSPRWLPDTEACMLCHEDFGLLRRRHRCRFCGWGERLLRLLCKPAALRLAISPCVAAISGVRRLPQAAGGGPLAQDAAAARDEDREARTGGERGLHQLLRARAGRDGGPVRLAGRSCRGPSEMTGQRMDVYIMLV